MLNEKECLSKVFFVPLLTISKMHNRIFFLKLDMCYGLKWKNDNFIKWPVNSNKKKI